MNRRFPGREIPPETGWHELGECQEVERRLQVESYRLQVFRKRTIKRVSLVDGQTLPHTDYGTLILVR